MNEQALRRFNRKYDVNLNGCWVWNAAKLNNGYGRFGLDGVNRLAHVVSFEHYKGATLGLNVMHTCDNKSCVNPSHLFLGDHQDNMRDAVRKDKWTPCKLKSEDIPKIKERLAQDKTLKEIADEFGVHFNTISRIKLGKAWNYV